MSGSPRAGWLAVCGNCGASPVCCGKHICGTHIGTAALEGLAPGGRQGGSAGRGGGPWQPRATPAPTGGWSSSWPRDTGKGSFRPGKSSDGADKPVASNASEGIELAEALKTGASPQGCANVAVGSWCIDAHGRKVGRTPTCVTSPAGAPCGGALSAPTKRLPGPVSPTRLAIAAALLAADAAKAAPAAAAAAAARSPGATALSAAKSAGICMLLLAKPPAVGPGCWPHGRARTIRGDTDGSCAQAPRLVLPLKPPSAEGTGGARRAAAAAKPPALLPPAAPKLPGRGSCGARGKL